MEDLSDMILVAVDLIYFINLGRISCLLMINRKLFFFAEVIN